MSLPTTTGGVGGAAGGGGLRGAVVPHQSPSTQRALNYALQVCFSRRKLFKEVRSPPSIYQYLQSNSDHKNQFAVY